MAQKKYHEAPLVPKMPISLVVLAWSDTESTALRATLEYFGCRVDTHWVGSRKEFIDILKGNIPTQDIVVLSCHGDERGMLMEEEKPVSPRDIENSCRFDGKVVLSLGCDTGTQKFARAFLQKGKCEAYIAPKGYPFGNTSLLFAIHLFYELQQHKKLLRDAVEEARKYDKESAVFKFFAD